MAPSRRWRSSASVGCTAVLATLTCCQAAPVVRIGFLHTTYTHPATLRLLDSVAVAEGNRWGIRVELVRDTVSNATEVDQVVERANRLADQGIVALVVFAPSRQVLAASTVGERRRLPVIGPNNSSVVFRRTGPWTFAVPPDDSLQGVHIARFAAESLGARTVALFYHPDEYGVGIRLALRDGLRAQGVTLLAERAVHPTNDLTVLAEAVVLRGVPDVAVVAAYPEEAGSLARVLHGRVPSTRLILSDAAYTEPDVLRQMAGPAVDAAYVVHYWVPGGGLESGDFERAYLAARGRPLNSPVAYVRDVFALLAQATAQRPRSARGVRDHLASLGQSRPAFRGVTGPIVFGGHRPDRFVTTRGDPVRPASASPPLPP